MSKFAEKQVENRQIEETLNIREFTDSVNIAEELDEDALNAIGGRLKELIEADEMSRSKWMEDNDKWLELAEQVTEPKSYPWPGASNVKFPLLTTAAIQFHARAYPALLGNREICKSKILGNPDEEKKARAARVAKFQSIQLTDLMESWTEEMDRLLFILPITGLAYKKTYYSPVLGEIKSELLSARDVIVNYYANGYERARITHRLEQDPNEVLEFINEGIYLDVDITRPAQIQASRGTRDKSQGLSPPGVVDDQVPYVMYESHCWWDLDGDGYKEPYIITIESKTGKVLRIVARWDETGLIERDGKIVRIKPTEFFTPYKFLPDPDSKTYGLGFGKLLGPTNDVVNTLINILTDSGHMSSLQSGFLSRGVRVKGGTVRFRPNEWKVAQTSLDDLNKGIVPLPTQQPSNVLLELLGLLINAGKDLSSVQDAMVGRNPGQNQPHATTEAVIEQGEKVFNGIYKRIYRQLSSEFRKIYLLNKEFLPNIVYVEVLDDDLADVVKDFDVAKMDIVPSAESDMIMETQKIIRANSLIQKAAAGLPINMQVATRRMLEAEGHENIEELMEMPPPQPSVEQLKFQLDEKRFQYEQFRDQAEHKLKSLEVREKSLKGRLEAAAKLKSVELDEAELGIQVDQQAMEEIHRQRDEVLRAMEIESANFAAAVGAMQKQQSNSNNSDQ